MSEVVDHLAELTGYRDRDVMDVTLVGSLRDLLEPLSVAIYRCVGETPNERWLTRARMSATDPVATADPLWADLEALPLLADQRREIRHQPVGCRIRIDPVAGRLGVWALPRCVHRHQCEDLAGCRVDDVSRCERAGK